MSVVRKTSRISILLLFLTIRMLSAAQSTNVSVFDSSASDSLHCTSDTLSSSVTSTEVPFIHLVTPDQDASLIRMSDDDILDHAGKVVFRVNRFDVFTNDSLLHLLANEILPKVNRDSLRLVRLVLRGAASPEGPYANNLRLSKQRAQTLVDFLRARLSVPVDESVLSVETVAEDYYLLCALMRRANDPDHWVVNNLVQHHVPHYQFTLLKQRLQRLQHGRLWPRLLREYFPELRAARLVLFFEKPFPVVRVVPLRTVVPEESLLYEDLPPLELPPFDIPRRELLSIKSNLLFDFAYMPFGYNRWCPIPNVALEYYPLHGHFTFGASIDFPWWQDYDAHKYFQVRNYQLETRYYLRSGDVRSNIPGQGAAFRGLYLKAYAHGGLFCFAMNADKGWIGEGVGGGLGVGYVLPLTRKGHWRLEFGAQFGYIWAKHDPFQYEYRGSVNLQDHLYYYDWTLPASQFKKRQYRFNWIGPTRVDITLTYDLLYRRVQKRGVSFKSSETVERRYE